MTNEQAIHEAKAAFQVSTGKVATKLYLGAKTKKDVFYHLRLQMTVSVAAPNQASRAEYAGMAVYEVDESNYVAVGL